MTDLAAFLLARIAEDERVARVADIGVGHGVRPDELWTVTNPPRGEVCAIPSRVLAECEAKRRIVETATGGGDCQGHPGSWQPHADYGPGFCRNYDDNDILRLLALPYADHPDYRKEWKP